MLVKSEVRTLEDYQKCDMAYWFKIISGLKFDLPVPMPTTAVIPVDWKWDKSGNYALLKKRSMDKVMKYSKRFEYPLFVRTGQKYFMAVLLITALMRNLWRG